jgi:hypothetical protein
MLNKTTRKFFFQLANMILCIFVLLVSVPAQPAFADSLSKSWRQETEWRELRTTNFAVIYPTEYEHLASMVIHVGNILDYEYERLAVLFETSLLTPITIRIYPDLNDYKKFNPLVRVTDENLMHSHIGVREIVLIAQNMTMTPIAWQADGLNAVRYELGVLFTQHLTDNKAPEGLLNGVGAYAQDPDYLFGRNFELPTDLEDPPSMRFLLEEGKLVNSPQFIMGAASIVAFFVDVYGWPSFLEFLKQIATVESTRRAMTDVYKIDQIELQNQWKQYYSLYFESHGASHILYRYDLSPYLQLIESGAYTEAVSQLPDVIAFLEKIKSEESLKQALFLMDQARLGQEGNRLVYEARKSLQDQEYDLSLLYVDQANAIFAELSDQRHQNELEHFRDLAQEILDLHSVIDQIEVAVSLNSQPNEYAADLLRISHRASEIGDRQGLQRANDLLETIEGRQNQQMMVQRAAGMGLAVLLVGLRLWLLRRKPSPEAQLL